MGDIWNALLMTLTAGAATGIGGALILFKKKLSSNLLAASLGLSAGVMIFISLAELYPEAMAAMENTAKGSNGKALVLFAFFAGMGIITLIDFLIPDYENPHEASGLSLNETGTNESSLKKLGVMSAIAIGIHNFPEGMATFISSINDPQMGAGIAFAIAIHNIPEGIAVAIPIYYTTRRKGKALFYAILSGLTEPAGAAVCYALTSVAGVKISAGGTAFPLILAAVAGIMIYISLDELLPTAEKHGKHHAAIGGVVAGMAIMGASLLII